MGDKGGRQSFSEENYLKVIYSLGYRRPDKISLTSLSEAINTKPSSVIDMVKKLSGKKLVSYDKSRGIRLTEKGKKIAIQIIRRHRLWEVFLLEKLEYHWDEIHDIAEQLEHISDRELADRLDKYLGYPEYDPHGDPIPKANGDMAAAFKKNLAEVPVGTSCQVVGVKDNNSSFLLFLRKLDISLGTHISVVEQIDFDNSLVIEVEDSEKTLVSKIFAENLLVALT